MSEEAALQTVRFGERELEFGGRYIASMRESNALLEDAEALRRRLAEDGYLLLRGLHDRQAVLDARRQVFQHLAPHGLFAPGAALDEGRINDALPARERGRFLGGHDSTRVEAFRAVVEGAPLMAFYERLFGEAALTFDYKWMRLVDRGQFTGAHYDNVYMNRGSENLLTMWTPVGDCDIDNGPLAVLVGSHDLPSYAKVRETYGRMDVDRDRVTGWFSNDPVELVERYGGRWATTAFRAGDALIFGMFTMHGSLSNLSDRYRLSADTRYQPASDPVDERWVGAAPIGHYAWQKGETVPMERKRADWGV